MSLPLLVSMPHAGLLVPAEVEELCILTRQQIIEDGDEGAAEIYSLGEEVEQLVTSDVARAVVDLNRAESDRRRDGVVKTHTCWDVPVYRQALPEELIDVLLERYYRPYHRRLTRLAGSGVIAGIDCHTMAAVGPPVGPDPGVPRPFICLSNGDGTCPQEWLVRLAACLSESFDEQVSLNHPFTGGFITRSHSTELPWIQLELSRGSRMSRSRQRDRLVVALSRFVEMIHEGGHPTCASPSAGTSLQAEL
jgi:formiminoglutamase